MVMVGAMVKSVVEQIRPGLQQEMQELQPMVEAYEKLKPFADLIPGVFDAIFASSGQQPQKQEQPQATETQKKESTTQEAQQHEAREKRLQDLHAIFQGRSSYEVMIDADKQREFIDALKATMTARTDKRTGKPLTDEQVKIQVRYGLVATCNALYRKAYNNTYMSSGEQALWKALAAFTEHEVASPEESAEERSKKAGLIYRDMKDIIGEVFPKKESSSSPAPVSRRTEEHGSKPKVAEAEHPREQNRTRRIQLLEKVLSDEQPTLEVFANEMYDTATKKNGGESTASMWLKAQRIITNPSNGFLVTVATRLKERKLTPEEEGFVRHVTQHVNTIRRNKGEKAATELEALHEFGKKVFARYVTQAENEYATRTGYSIEGEAVNEVAKVVETMATTLERVPKGLRTRIVRGLADVEMLEVIRGMREDFMRDNPTVLPEEVPAKLGHMVNGLAEAIAAGIQQKSGTTAEHQQTSQEEEELTDEEVAILLAQMDAESYEIGELPLSPLGPDLLREVYADPVPDPKEASGSSNPRRQRRNGNGASHEDMSSKIDVATRVGAVLARYNKEYPQFRIDVHMAMQNILDEVLYHLGSSGIHEFLSGNQMRQHHRLQVGHLDLYNPSVRKAFTQIGLVEEGKDFGAIAGDEYFSLDTYLLFAFAYAYHEADLVRYMGSRKRLGKDLTITPEEFWLYVKHVAHAVVDERRGALQQAQEVDEELESELGNLEFFDLDEE